MIIGIIAIAQNFAIGRDGKLPWHFSADMRFFKRTTTGNAVVMGSATWLELGKPLPSRLNILLTRSADTHAFPGAMVVHRPEDVTALADYLRCDTFIIGGAKTYDTFANDIEKWIVTEIPLTVDDADTFMPTDFLDGFTIAGEDDIGDGLRVKTYLRR